MFYTMIYIYYLSCITQYESSCCPIPQQYTAVFVHIVSLEML